MTEVPLREVCFLIGRNGSVLWFDASTSPASLPDSRSRWEAIWSLREDLEEIAHSHPAGPLAFSHEDETTMAALCRGLARRPTFSIVAPTGMLARGPDGVDHRVAEEPWWAPLLRCASGMPENQEGNHGNP